MRATPSDVESEALARAEDILRQIKLALHPGLKRATIELAPAELGRISIHMALRRGGLATILRAESPETLALLRERLPELSALLEREGVRTTSFELHSGFAGSSHSGQAPSERQRSARGAAPAAGKTARSASITRPTASLSAHIPVRGLAGGVDLYA